MGHRSSIKLILALRLLQVTLGIDMLSLGYWESKHALSFPTTTISACRGLSMLLSNRIQEGVQLIESLQLEEHDYVAREALGAAYGSIARKLLAVNSVMAKDALMRSVRYYELGNYARETFKESPLFAAEDAVVVKTYPQYAFNQPRALAIRGLGDALRWMGRHEDAVEVFAIGVREGFWSTYLCRPSPSEIPPHPSYYSSKYIGKYFFTAVEMGYISQPFMNALGAIKEEVMDSAAVSDVWRRERAGLHSDGNWSQFVFMVNGVLNMDACQAHQSLCSILSSIPSLHIRDGQVKLSRMRPGTVVRPHAGPSNERLRMHCSILIPENGASTSSFRVGTESRSWEDGDCFVFQESCEHEVIIAPEAKGDRIVLIIDFASPFINMESFSEAVLPSFRPLAVEQYLSFWESSSREL